MTFHPFKKGLLLNLAKNDQVQNDATMKQTLTIKFFIVAYLFFKVGKYVPSSLKWFHYDKLLFL